VGQNAINLLVAQHQEIRNLLDQVESGPAERRALRFEELRQLLMVHETAEDEVLRPVTRREVPDGDQVAADREAEERAANQALDELAGLDVDSAEFLERFASFKADVLAHAENEEESEFPAIRDREADGDLMRLGDEIKAAQDPPTSNPDPAATAEAARA
jgi:hemerythrin superfamily protein